MFTNTNQPQYKCILYIMKSMHRELKGRRREQLIEKMFRYVPRVGDNLKISKTRDSNGGYYKVVEVNNSGGYTFEIEVRWVRSLE